MEIAPPDRSIPGLAMARPRPGACDLAPLIAAIKAFERVQPRRFAHPGALVAHGDRRVAVGARGAQVDRSSPNARARNMNVKTIAQGLRRACKAEHLSRGELWGLQGLVLKGA